MKKRQSGISWPLSSGHCPLLSLESISAGYERRTVLSNISLSVGVGECVGIVGPNGGGKTTLLKVMTGMLHPTSGSVMFGGRPLQAWSDRDRARRMAVVHQEHDAVMPVRVGEAVMSGRTPHLAPFAWETDQDQRLVNGVMEQMGIGGFQDRWLHALSSGERQRVWMAMAMAQEPQLLFLDEPTSHLDLRFQMEVMDHAVALQKKGGAVVWVSHDLNLAVRYCTRMVALSQGGVVAEGSPAQVVTSSMVKAVYGEGVGVEQAQDGFPAVLPKRRGASI